MSSFINFIEKKNLSKVTINNYKSSFKTFIKRRTDWKDLLQDGTQSIKYITENYSNLNTQITIISMLMHVCKFLNIDNSYNILRLKLKKINDERFNKKNSIPSLNKQLKWISYDKLIDLYDCMKLELEEFGLGRYNYKMNYRRDAKNIVRNTLMLSLYLADIEKNPPRRVRDYCNMKIVETINDINTNLNFYVKNPPLFIFNDYKTKNIYGQQKIKVCEEIQYYIDKQIKVNKPKNYLFESNKLKPIQPSYFTNIFSSIFKNRVNKNLSVTLLRNIIISHFHKNTPTNKKMNDLAFKMGHSVKTQLSIYRQDLDNTGFIKNG